MGFFDSIKKREVLSWAFFDFANSSYALLIASFVFPIFFREVISPSNGDFWWGLNVSIAIILGAILSPLTGAIADYDSRKKIKFILFTLLSIIGTTLLFFTGSNMLLIASLLFIITHTFYEIAVTIYDSFLTQVSTKNNAGRISGLGWGLGYMGGISAMLLLKPLYDLGYQNNLFLYKLTFPLTALFFFVFALPSMIFLKDIKKKKKIKLLNLIKIGFSRIKNTIQNIKKHKNIAWFLVSFYFMNDALVTIFTFLPIYAKATIQLNFTEIAVLLLIVQLIGFPSAVLFGYLSDKKGAKKILLFTLIIWIIIVILIALSSSKLMFYLISALTGLVIGSSQSVARSWLSKIIPANKKAEFFGFNGFASKVAATTGPLIFGIISVYFNQRIAMIPIALFFIIAFLLFFKVKE
ncbi:MFS transporter [Candidatus Woesearchaeota archaeon]|nr:MFS transporter [Candidatus Woesearchaeota archaeon]